MGPVPAGLYWSAALGWALSAVLLASGGPALGRWSLLLVVVVFVAIELAAACLLARLALARTGAPRARLWLAAAATALFAVAILLAGAGGGDLELAQEFRQAARLVALISAVGYLLAFTPPGWARRAWSAHAAYDVVRRLLQAPPDTSAAQVWQRYAEAVCRPPRPAASSCSPAPTTLSPRWPALVCRHRRPHRAGQLHQVGNLQPHHRCGPTIGHALTDGGSALRPRLPGPVRHRGTAAATGGPGGAAVAEHASQSVQRR